MVFQILHKTDQLWFLITKVDVGGYGVYWNDELDIAADELWENGIETDIVHTLDIKKRFASRLIAMLFSIMLYKSFNFLLTF